MNKYFSKKSRQSTGANPSRRDNGRRLCAAEWARFCGRHSCADAIEKYIKSKKYIIAKAFFLSKEKWNSEPELVEKAEKQNKGRRASNAVVGFSSPATSSTPGGKGRRDSMGWIQRHLSLKRKTTVRTEKRQSLSLHVELQVAAIAGSAPVLVRSSSNSKQGRSCDLKNFHLEKASQDVLAFCSILSKEVPKSRPVLPSIFLTTGDCQQLEIFTNSSAT